MGVSAKMFLIGDEDDFNDFYTPVVQTDRRAAPVVDSPRPEILVRRAREAYADFHGMDVNEVGEREVAASAAGIAGWAASTKVEAAEPPSPLIRDTMVWV